MTDTPRTLLTTWALRQPLASGILTPAGIPAFAASLGFDGIETLDRQCAAWPAQQLESLSRLCRDQGVPVVHDINCDLTLRDPAARRQQIDHVIRQLDVAASLGAAVARICLGGQDASVQRPPGRRGRAGPKTGSTGALMRLLSQPCLRHLLHRLRQRLPARVRDLEGKLDRAIAALRELLPHARRHGTRLGIENHWGVSARPEWIMRVVATLDSPLLGTCVDFGNFPRDTDAYAGIAMLLTRAVHVQAKALAFDRAGNERHIDIGRCMALVRAAGYRGPLGIEYEGAGNPVSGSLRLRQLVVRSPLPRA